MKPRRILRYLPENYQLAATDERGVLHALLQVMDAMHAPVEGVLRGIERYVDPHRAPDPFVVPSSPDNAPTVPVRPLSDVEVRRLEVVVDGLRMHAERASHAHCG